MCTQSIKSKLKVYSKSQGHYVDEARLLKMYVAECAFRRIAASNYSDKMVLKGAMALVLYIPDTTRSTKDADILVNARWSIEDVRNVFTEILSIDCDDGIKFDPSTLQIDDAGADREYPGCVLVCRADLEGTQTSLNIDLCFGEAVVPDPEKAVVTKIIDSPEAELLIYPREAMLAEKTETIVRRGMPNSRMNDFLDIFMLAENSRFDRGLLVDAFRATFARRETPIPESTPTGLTSEFFEDKKKVQAWKAMLVRLGKPTKATLKEAVESTLPLILPILDLARSDDPAPSGYWCDGKWHVE